MSICEEVPSYILTEEQMKEEEPPKKRGRKRRLSLTPEIRKEKQKNYFSKWYMENVKDKKKRAICECGVEVAYMNLCNHKKTMKHKRNMENSKK